MNRTATAARIARAASMIALAATLVVGAQACSWFKKKDQSDEAGRNAQAIPAPTPRPEVPPTPRPPIDPESALLTIYFDFDQSVLRGDQLPRLESDLNWLKQNAGASVTIEGHCDERGTTEYNFALGERRAQAVRDYLIKGGIAASRINVLSKGEEQPADAGHDEEAWAKNRRALFLRAQ